MTPQPLKSQAIFVGKTVVAHLISYAIAATAGYYFLLRDLYNNEASPLRGYLATPGEPEEWALIGQKLFPIELVRGFLLGIVFFSISRTLQRWGKKRRFIAIIGFYFIVGFLASPGISPGGLEGMLYMQNQFAPLVHERFFWVTFLQSVIMALILSNWIRTSLPEEN